MSAPNDAVAAAVAGLTRAQREAILGRNSIEGVWFSRRGSRAGGAYSRMCRRLADVGLVDRTGPYPLTPLGISVRAALAKSKGEQG